MKSYLGCDQSKTSVHLFTSNWKLLRSNTELNRGSFPSVCLCLFTYGAHVCKPVNLSLKHLLKSSWCHVHLLDSNHRHCSLLKKKEEPSITALLTSTDNTMGLRIAPKSLRLLWFLGFVLFCFWRVNIFAHIVSMYHVGIIIIINLSLIRQPTY